MASNTYTDDEFKKVLKNLFAEKKRVKELEKQLEEGGLQKKFQAKLTDIHKLSLTEEYAKLKAAYLERTQESEQLKEQVEKLRQALKKLVVELKQTRVEIDSLRSSKPASENEEAKEELKVAHQKIEQLQEQYRLFEALKEKLAKEEGDALVAQRQLLHLEEQLEESRRKNALLEEGKQASEQKIEALNKSLEETKGDLAGEKKETHRFELERTRLVERLADSLGQVQRQTEMVKELRQELQMAQKKIEGGQEKEKTVEQEILHLKSELAKACFETTQVNKSAEYQVAQIREEKEACLAKIAEMTKEREEFAKQFEMWEVQQEEYLKLQLELAETKEQLQKSDLTQLRQEYEAKLKEQAEMVSQKEAFQEEVLERSYAKMRELVERHGEMVEEKEVLNRNRDEADKLIAKFEKEHATLQTALKNSKLQCEERDAEIRKAQQHLAKKVKEATILRDLVERQKGELQELHASIDKQKNESERLQNNLNLQRMHEEKLQTMTKERLLAAESLTKEWQEKYLALQQDWQEKKGQLIELQKMRKTYDQMATTLSSLKNILGNTLEPLSAEEPDYTGH